MGWDIMRTSLRVTALHSYHHRGLDICTHIYTRMFTNNNMNYQSVALTSLECHLGAAEKNKNLRSSRKLPPVKLQATVVEMIVSYVDGAMALVSNQRALYAVAPCA